MERITISVSDEFAAELAAFMERERYDNRSEAVRDLARLGLNRARIDSRHIRGLRRNTLLHLRPSYP
ncbi:MAG TPA: ribbon-helix-helix protein, CopG family [Roseiarcus sp.]